VRAGKNVATVCLTGYAFVIVHAKRNSASGGNSAMNCDPQRTPVLTKPPGFRILPLDRRHNSAMLAILHESPIETGGLSICFDRQPDIFLMAELKYSQPLWGGFFEGAELAGFVLLGNHEAFVNGRITPVTHIANCYIRPQSRGHGYLRAALPFFFSDRSVDTAIGYAVIMKGNRAAESQSKEKPADKPWGLQFKKIGDLSARNILFSLLSRKKPAYAVRTARLDDIDAIVGLLCAEHSNRLFGLVTDRDRFAAALENRPGLSIDNYCVIEQSGRLIGVCAAWDTGAFKQNRVVRYGPWLNAVRGGYNFLSFLTGTTALPAPGKSFRNIAITDWAVQDRSVKAMHALLQHVHNIYYGRGYHSMIFGSCADDPVLEATRGFFRTEVVSAIMQVSLGGKWPEPGAIQTTLPFIDIAFL
jgi:hypothetical protein